VAEYWGATAQPNIKGSQHYADPNIETQWTPAPSSDGSGTSIERIESQIHNMHPEFISTLADQWDNTYTMLSQIHTFLFNQSNVLHDHHWTSGKARDAFMKAGPGHTLAYLDQWMQAAQDNATALRHLVLIAKQARIDIDDVVAKYKADLASAAKDVSVGDQFGEWVQGFTVDWGQAKDREIHENVQNAKKKWTIEAQKVAYNTSQQIFPYMSTLSAATGTPVQPLNVVMPLAPGPGGSLPHLPGGGHVPKVPAKLDKLPPNVKDTPPALPPGAPGQPPALPPSATEEPPALPGDLTADPSDLVATPPPAPVLNAAAPALPPPPPAFLTNPANLGNFGNPAAFAKTPGPLPGGAPGGLPGGLPTGGKLGAPGSVPGSQPPNPGQLTKSAFQRPGTPSGAGAPPGRTLRRPSGEGGEPGRPGSRDLRRQSGQPGRPGAGEPHQPGRPGDRRKGDRSENRERTPGTPLDGDEAFGRPTGNATPPVLKNPTGNRDRRRPGSSQELHPAAYGNGEDVFQHRDGAAPPVLNRPSRPAEVTPPPGTRRGERERERTRTGPAAEWVGADEARAEAGLPVLDAPAHPPAGSLASRLEEVPRGLRSRAATEAAADRSQRARPGSVSPELSKRRTERTHQQQHEADDEALGVVTDEQAFEVATPGGGVVTSQREQVYEPEQRRVIGGQ
jgi:hypothetical protein